MTCVLGFLPKTPARPHLRKERPNEEEFADIVTYLSAVPTVVPTFPTP
jgi:hypothetical protein